MSGEEDDIRLHTPGEWIPFDTILCTCTSGFSRVEYLYLGIGQYVYPGDAAAASAGGREVQLLLNLRRDRATWSNGDWLRNNAHIHDKYDPEIMHIFR